MSLYSFIADTDLFCKTIRKCVFYITNEMQLIKYFLLLSVLYMFGAVFPPTIRSL